jgi:hypothetical protein
MTTSKHSPSAYIRSRFRLPKEVVEYIRSLVEELHPQSQSLFFHIAACSIQDPWNEGWIPISSYLIRKELSQARWQDLHETGLIETIEYDRSKHRSREFRLVSGLTEIIIELYTGSTEKPDRWYDLFTGKPSRKKKRTQCTVNNNPVGLNGPLQDGLRVYSQMQTPYNRRSVIDHLSRMRNEYEATTAFFRQGGHKRYTEEYQSAFLQNGGQHLSGYDGQRLTPEYRAVLSIRGRYLNDLSCYTSMRSQEIALDSDHLPYVSWYLPAYSVQMSGRVGHKDGGLQSCSREMKEAAYSGIPNLYNYDLKASQPRILLKRFQDVPEEMRPNSDWIESYLDDPIAKVRFAEQAGVSVDLWKSALCAVMMGASLPKRWGGSLGEVARLVGVNHPGNEEGVFQRLRSQLEDLYDQIQVWHDYLMDHKIKDEAFTSRGGRMIKNESGHSLRLGDLDKRKYRRRGQVAAFYLQGLEAAFIHSLAALGNTYGFTVVANEHDGLVTLGAIPEAAVKQAAKRVGLHNPVLVEKPFVGRKLLCESDVSFSLPECTGFYITSSSGIAPSFHEPTSTNCEPHVVFHDPIVLQMANQIGRYSMVPADFWTSAGKSGPEDYYDALNAEYVQDYRNEENGRTYFNLPQSVQFKGSY